MSGYLMGAKGQGREDIKSVAKVEGKEEKRTSKNHSHLLENHIGKRITHIP